MVIHFSEFLNFSNISLFNRKIFAISPHSDDLSYSISGILKSIQRVTQDITLCTVFSLSDYILTDITDVNVVTVTNLRKNEDTKFKSKLSQNINMIWLDYEDAPLRGHNVELSCHVDKPTYLDIRQKQKIVEYLKRELAHYKDPLIFSPMSIGNHIDHIIVNESITDLVCEGFFKKNQVLFYEDLPYAEYHKNVEYKSLLNKISNKMETKIQNVDISVKEHIAFKWAAITSYVSQMDLNAWQMIMRRLKELGGCERLYVANSNNSAH